MLNVIRWWEVGKEGNDFFSVSVTQCTHVIYRKFMQTRWKEHIVEYGLYAAWKKTCCVLMVGKILWDYIITLSIILEFD